MANEEQLAILKQGFQVWNKWRDDNPGVNVDLGEADLLEANLNEANLWGAILIGAHLEEAHFNGAELGRANLRGADLRGADLRGASLMEASLIGANLSGAELFAAGLLGAYLSGTKLTRSVLEGAQLGKTVLVRTDLSEAMGLNNARHAGPSSISTDTLVLSQGNIPEAFLRGCGLSDWEIEEAKLYNPDLSNEEVSRILYRVYDLRATQALQISPLFISYSHNDGAFVDKIGKQLTKKGVRYWRDIHDMKAGRMEKQIDRAIRQNPTVLLVLSEHSLRSDWVEHEVRTARELEEELGRDVLCPVALDDSWKDSRWPKRLMEQVMEYNILNFSDWENEDTFAGTFNKLVDGLGLFYKG